MRWRFILRIRTANPTKFITLTTLHKGERDERLAIMVKALPRLATAVRKARGEFEYLRMLEQCEDGYPHFHLLARSNFIPHSDLRELWKKLTGASIVDIRKAHGRSTGYIAKYLTKARDASGNWTRQRVSVSKHFWKNAKNIQTHVAFTHSRSHPADTAAARPSLAYERLRPQYYAPHERDAGDENPEELTNASYKRDRDR